MWKRILVGWEEFLKTLKYRWERGDKLQLQRVLLQRVRIQGFPQRKGQANLPDRLNNRHGGLQLAVGSLGDGGGMFLWLNGWFQLNVRLTSGKRPKTYLNLSTSNCLDLLSLFYGPELSSNLY